MIEDEDQRLKHAIDNFLKNYLLQLSYSPFRKYCRGFFIIHLARPFIYP